MVLLRPALRSTASPQTVLRRTIEPSPLSMFWSRIVRPGFGGGFWRAGTWALLVGFAVRLLLQEGGVMLGIRTPPRPPLQAHRAVPRLPHHADVKRGSRSRGGQSAAEGGGAKRWPERDREPLFHRLARRGPRTANPTAATLPSRHRSFGGAPPRVGRPGTGRGERRA